MTDEWSLRNEILRTTHLWPIVFLFCLGGILLGWSISILWPSPQRAAKEIYIGLDVNHALNDRNASEHAGVQFNNPDDYKNWQMTNLNVFIKMDWIIAETLSRLQKQDEYWSKVDREELSQTLDVNWRNAGVWRLIAEGDNQLHNTQAITAWHDIVLENVQGAIDGAKKSLALDAQLSAIATTQAQTVSRLAELTHIRETMESWGSTISQRPDDQTVSKSERTQLQLAFAGTNLTQFGKPVFDAFPAPGATNNHYTNWLEQIIAAMDQEILTVQTQIQASEKQNQEVLAQFSDASRKSYGLSANLQVREITKDPPEHYTVRPTGLLILAGGLLGLLLWTTLWLARITMRPEQ